MEPSQGNLMATDTMLGNQGIAKVKSHEFQEEVVSKDTITTLKHK